MTAPVRDLARATGTLVFRRGPILLGVSALAAAVLLPLHLTQGLLAFAAAAALLVLVDPLLSVTALLALVPAVEPGVRGLWRRFPHAYAAGVRAWLLVLACMLVPQVGPLLAVIVAIGVSLAPLLALRSQAPVRASLRLLWRHGSEVFFMLGLVGLPTLGVMLAARELGGGARLNLWARYAQELALVLGGSVFRLVLWASLARPTEPEVVAEVFE